jgi:hypothetical protein
MTHEEKRLTCEVCRKEIPEAAALHAEAQGYILHFCEAGCLASWRKAMECAAGSADDREPRKEEKR